MRKYLVTVEAPTGDGVKDEHVVVNAKSADEACFKAGQNLYLYSVFTFRNVKLVDEIS